MHALSGLALLLALQAVGEALAHAWAPALPGPVLGLALLLPLLASRRVRTPVAAAAELLLAHLSLLFVPVGVGVVMHLPVVAAHGLGLAVALVLSTWVGMTVTAAVLRALLKDVPAEASDG